MVPAAKNLVPEGPNGQTIPVFYIANIRCYESWEVYGYEQSDNHYMFEKQWSALVKDL